VSLLVHAGLLAALVVSTGPEPETPEEDEEEVTFVDIRRFAPPPPPAASSAPAGEPDPTPSQPETRPQPTPQQPRPQPRTPPRSTDIVEPVDSLPNVPLGSAPSAPSAPRIERSTGGTGTGTEGVAGGVAGGVEGGVEGGKVGGVVGGQGEEVPEPGGTYIASVVDRQAELTNRRDLPRLMRRLYPSSLQSVGAGGRVIVQFVVGTNGRIDMSSVKVISSTNAAFEGPTKEALSEFRFRPARIGDRTVRMLTQMPVVWEVE
jgi:periplasmic protein TonB